MRTPCDAVAQSAVGEIPCEERAKPWVLTATILASSMAFIDSTAINIALPSLQANFHANVVDVQWVVESYGLFLGALILVGGSLGDLFGRRLIFMAGVAVFTVRLCRLRSCAKYPCVDCREKRPRRRRCASGAWQPRDYQHIFRREKPRSGDWRLVWLYRDHHRRWPCSGRMARRACFLALGFLY